MISQSLELGQIPQEVLDLFASKIALGDYYVIMQTAPQEFRALVYNPFSKSCQEYLIFQPEGLVTWTYVHYEDSQWDYSYSNECYVYSNMGVGTELHLPVYDRINSFCSLFLCVTLMFAILFKGVLFPCLLGSKRKR